MVSIRSIISENNATFYNYRTGAEIRIWPRITAFIFLSPCLSFLLTENLIDFINSINTVASILLGFGFSVLFYIASANEAPLSSDSSLEKKNRIERLRKLSKELFHNVSYFVMTASAALAFAMIVIAPEAQNDWLAKRVLPVAVKVADNAADYVWWLQFLFRSIFFFLILEGGYTFGRIVGRVNFLFQQKLKINP